MNKKLAIFLCALFLCTVNAQNKNPNTPLNGFWTSVDGQYSEVYICSIGTHFSASFENIARVTQGTIPEFTYSVIFETKFVEAGGYEGSLVFQYNAETGLLKVDATYESEDQATSITYHKVSPTPGDRCPSEVNLDLNGVWLLGEDLEFHIFQQRGTFIATAFFENEPIMGLQGKVSSVGGYATFDWVSDQVGFGSILVDKTDQEHIKFQVWHVSSDNVLKTYTELGIQSDTEVVFARRINKNTDRVKAASFIYALLTPPPAVTCPAPEECKTVNNIQFKFAGILNKK